MKKNQIRKSVAALAMAAVVSVSLLGYGCGSKPASSTAGVSGEFTGTAKGMGGDVTVTLTLTDGKITGCTAEGKDETPGIGTMALEQLPGAIAESGSIAVDGVATATITSDAIKEAAAAALTAAGLNPDDYKTAVEKTGSAEDSTVEADVVVVGAGGAGMTAAITAAAEGKSVVILESQPMVGGNSVRATGGMNAGKTVYQDENEFGESAGVEKTLKTAAEKYADNATITALAKTVSEQWAAYQADPKGYFDSVELMELDTMIGGKGINDPALVETLCSNSADAIDWLGEQGITLNSVSSAGGASVKRIHRPVNEEGKVVSVGAYMVPLLEEDCQKAGVQIMVNTTATEILTDDNGAAVGIKATGASGETITINAKAVILTSGGFGANMDMGVEYKPELKGFMTTNAPGILGQGIKMAQAIGADTVDMDQIQIHPTVEANTAALITEGLRGDGAVLINAEGKRFIDEVGTRDVVSAAEIAQTGSYSWLVVDQAMVDASSVIQGYIKKGYTFAWGSDVSEQGFTRDGIAVMPDAARGAELTGSDMARWTGLTAADKRKELTSKPLPEVNVTQEMRQAAFDNWETTDDHGMVIYGIAKDQNGKEYFMVKNSWGLSGKYKGIWYASKAFVAYKTMNILVHKDALPKDIAKKLGFK